MNIRTALSSRPRNLVLAFLAAGALTLAACQGGGEPAAEHTPTQTTATDSASATPTPSPAETAIYKPADASGKAQNVPVPVKPALADENSKEGLEAFTKYWFELLSYGYETGDVTELTALTVDACEFCVRVRQGIEDSYRDSGWQAGALVSVGSIEFRFVPDAPTQQVVVQVMQEPSTYFLRDGTEAMPASPAGNNAVAVIARYEGGWSIADMHALQ